MRAVVQLVSRACVSVEDSIRAEIARGLVVFVGVAQDDTKKEAALLAAKLAKLRIFPDEEGRLNRSVTAAEVSGDLLLVPNFTLFADCKKSRRPDFFAAAKGEAAEALFLHFCEALRLQYMDLCAAEGGRAPKILTGVFGAHMQVDLTNDGPVTLFLDTDTL